MKINAHLANWPRSIKRSKVEGTHLVLYTKDGSGLTLKLTQSQIKEAKALGLTVDEG